MRPDRPLPDPQRGNWMCRSCWQEVIGTHDLAPPPRCPVCGAQAQHPRDVKDWTDEEWSQRTGLPIDERWHDPRLSQRERERTA